MDQNSWLALLKQHRAIAVIRAADVKTGVAMAKAVVAGGFRLIEITWQSDRPAELIRQLRQDLGSSCQIGAGTLLSAQALKEAIGVGAQFCFAPHTDIRLIQIAQDFAIPFIPGALTPSEIVLAWQSGASSVKVFPCQSVGGPAYIRHLQGPLSHIPLIPTGGITVENGLTFLEAGAIAVGLSSSLFPKTLVDDQNWSAIAARSQALLAKLQA